LTTIGEKIADLKRDDQFEVFGRNVAAKLRALPPRHRIFAEKKINDVLFDAEMAAFHDQAQRIQKQINTVGNPAEPNSRQQPHSSNTYSATHSDDPATASNLTNFYSNYNPNYNQNYNPNYDPNFNPNFNPTFNSNYTPNQQPQ
jgi:hypothetical protein